MPWHGAFGSWGRAGQRLMHRWGAKSSKVSILINRINQAISMLSNFMAILMLLELDIDAFTVFSNLRSLFVQALSNIFPKVAPIKLFIPC